MKAVVQRVTDASVSVDGAVTGKIDAGLLVYLGVARNDSESDADWLSRKISGLRIFNDKNGTMNISLMDLVSDNARMPDAVNAAPVIGVLAVSQFTLLADARKGKRPSWNGAASPGKAKQLYEYFMESIRRNGLVCESGEFQAYMKVTYTNDGPVTILLDTNDLK